MEEPKTAFSVPADMLVELDASVAGLVAGKRHNTGVAGLQKAAGVVAA